MHQILSPSMQDCQHSNASSKMFWVTGKIAYRLPGSTEQNSVRDRLSEGGKITVRPELKPAEEFSVLVHEFAYELLHRGERRSETTKLVRETEAEAVACTVCSSVGLDTGIAASDYIQLYNGSSETLKESLQHIRDCAGKILAGLLDVEQPTADATKPAVVKQQTLF